MKDFQPETWYFRWVPPPQISRAGVHCTALLGEVEADRIYEITNPSLLSVLRDHPEWKEVHQKDYDAQTRADEKEQYNA